VSFLIDYAEKTDRRMNIPTVGGCFMIYSFFLSKTFEASAALPLTVIMTASLFSLHSLEISL
jgi:hypothetical protein